MATFFNGGIGTPQQRRQESRDEVDALNFAYQTVQDAREREHEPMPVFTSMSADALGLARALWRAGDFDAASWGMLSDAMEEAGDERLWWISLYRSMIDMTDPKSTNPNPDVPKYTGIVDYTLAGCAKTWVGGWTERNEQFNGLVEVIVGLRLYDGAKRAKGASASLYRWCLFRSLRLIDDSAKSHVVRLGARAATMVMSNADKAGAERRRFLLKEFAARLLLRWIMDAFHEPDAFHAMPGIEAAMTAIVKDVQKFMPNTAAEDIRMAAMNQGSESNARAIGVRMGQICEADVVEEQFNDDEDDSDEWEKT